MQALQSSRISTSASLAGDSFRWLADDGCAVAVCQDVGLRLAAGALKLAYGQEALQVSGPILSSVEATQRKDGQLQMKVREGGKA